MTGQDCAPSAHPTASAAVVEVLRGGAPQITAHESFTRHLLPDGTADWAGVLAEPDWSAGQRALIGLAAALCGAGHAVPGALSAQLTGRQSDLALALCRAARG